MKKIVLVLMLFAIISFSSCIRVYTSEVKQEPVEQTEETNDAMLAGLGIIAFVIVIIGGLGMIGMHDDPQHGGIR